MYHQLIYTQFFSKLSCYCCYSVTQLCLTLCDPVDCSTPGIIVFHYFLVSQQITITFHKRKFIGIELKHTIP